MIQLIYFIFLTYGALTNSSFAFGAVEKSDCTEIDLRKSSCLPPSKNQSDTGWCYAYAAADMVSYHFCQEISPAALGLMASEVKKKPGEFWVHGGWQDEAINLGNEHGFCLEKDLPSQLIINDKTMGLRRAYLNLINREKRLATKSDCDKTISDIRQVLPLANIIDIIKFIQDGQKAEELFALARSSCRNNINEKVSVDTCDGDGVNRLKFVNQYLESGPVSLGLVPSDENKIRVFSLPDGHAYSLIGRKWNSAKNRCDFLVHDSTGPYSIGSITVGADFQPNRWVSQEELMTVLNLPESKCFAIKK